MSGRWSAVHRSLRRVIKIPNPAGDGTRGRGGLVSKRHRYGITPYGMVCGEFCIRGGEDSNVIGLYLLAGARSV